MDQTPGDSFMYMEMRMSNVLIIHSRYYVKLQGIAAEVSGFIEFAFLFIWFISRPIRRLLYYETVINEVYNVE